MTENEFILADRLGVIRDTISKYGEDKFYLSFSGGKDSTVVHHLLDMAIPGNKIPRVFSKTGIEFKAIVDFVESLNDSRLVIIQPKKKVRETLEKVGYPFKSKEHSQKVMEYQKTRRITPHLQRYLHENPGRERYQCPSLLQYQFTDDFKLKVSNLCCKELKKKPVAEWEKKTQRHIGITGMRAEEGGIRRQLGCILTKNGKIHRFNPLIKVTDEWEEWFIKQYNIKLCELYYEPYNFERTGCVGCPYNIHIQQELETLERLLPSARKQAEYLWQPVYEEYRRIGYRLKREEQTKLF